MTGGVVRATIQAAALNLGRSSDSPSRPDHERMTPKTLILSRLLVVPLLLAVADPCRAKQDTNLTLDQAVEQVQHDTGGKVLSADRREFGRRTEYRIKVLTPSGYVRTFTVPSESDRRPPPAQSTKNPVGNGRGNKEKH